MKIFVVSRIGVCGDCGDDNWDDLLGARTTIESAKQLLESELEKECQKKIAYPVLTIEQLKDGHRHIYKITELELLE